MKRLIYISLIILFGCKHSPNEFYVKDIDRYNRDKCEYYICPTKLSDTKCNWVVGDCEKFIIGDTLKLMKNDACSN